MTDTTERARVGEVALSPCPFCGSPAIHWKAGELRDEGIINELAGCYGTDPDKRHPMLRMSIAAWNRRATPQPMGEDAVLPCDVKLPPATTVRAGCKLSTLRLALELRGMAPQPTVEAGDALRDEIAELKEEIASLKVENDRAWRERNEAYAKVKAWEATVYVEKLPMLAVPVNDWGPGGEGQTSIPQITPSKLTDLLNEIARLRAQVARMQSGRD